MNIAQRMERAAYQLAEQLMSGEIAEVERAITDLEEEIMFLSEPFGSYDDILDDIRKLKETML